MASSQRIKNSDADTKVRAYEHVCSLIARQFSALRVDHSSDDSYILRVPSDKDEKGVQALVVQRVDDAITISVELIQCSCNVQVEAGPFFMQLATLGSRCRLAPPPPGCASPYGLWVELLVTPQPLSILRQETMAHELHSIDALARLLQEELPGAVPDSELKKTYEAVAEVLEPVYALEPCGTDFDDTLSDWAAGTAAFLLAGASVAVSCESEAVAEAGLAAVARACKSVRKTLGRLRTPGVNPKEIVVLAKRAPGIVAVDSHRLSMGANPYEVSNDVRSLLSSLSSLGLPVLFTGTMAELQTVFHGGQGGQNDPLYPVVRHVPDLPLDLVVRHCVGLEVARSNRLSASTTRHVIERVSASVGALPAGQQARMVPLVTRRVINTWGTDMSSEKAIAAFAASAAEAHETLAGIAQSPRAERAADVQERFTRVLTGPALLDLLRDELLAQDDALEELVEKLQSECLSRPLHQPLRYCAQGTPGTGKSESAAILARLLGVPLINVDAASMPDQYTASSQLLGSARGIVGSYKSGRLEQAAKHFSGAVIEISDLDHAPPQVRSTLADLFLQVLETGEAQSAAGAMFSCASIIFAFTMNLPGETSERVNRSMGFCGAPSRGAVRREVSSEIRRMLSGAFLSRAGNPIVFEPLDGPALALIVERAVTKTVLTAAQRKNMAAAGVRVGPGVGEHVMASLDASTISCGARVIVEHARLLATKAFMRFAQPAQTNGSGHLVVTPGPEEQLTVTRE